MEDRELDTLFDFENHESTKEILKQAKVRSNLRIGGISLGLCALVVALGLILKIQITPWLVAEKTELISAQNSIYGANIMIGSWQEKYKIVGSYAVAPKYKLMDGIVVGAGEVTTDFKTINDKINLGQDEDWTKNQDAQTFSYLGQRIMKFYHPGVVYRSYAKDLEKLPQVENNKKIEMAISFDKAYTLDEVQKMLPQDITWNWSWADVYNEAVQKSLSETKDNLISKLPSTILEGDEVVGFSMTDKIGKTLEMPQRDFIDAINKLYKKGGKYKQQVEWIYKEIDINAQQELKIIGVVVSGDKTSLQQLTNKNFVKASSFGVIADIY